MRRDPNSMNLSALILALSLELTPLPGVTVILANGSLLDGNESGFAMKVVAIPSVSM